MFVLDSHCDTPSQILRLRDISSDGDHSQVDLPKLRRGGVDGAFWALYIPASMTEEEAGAYAGRLYDATLAAIRDNSTSAALATTVSQAYENREKGLFSVFLGMENGSPIGTSLGRLEFWYGRGIRYMTLCHSADNEICDSCASPKGRWNGLSPFGREVVAEMNRLGMLIDVSHVSDRTFYDVLECSSAPVAATHSCCRALSSHPRNMTDDMIRELAGHGGVIQVNFYPVFLDSSFAVTLDRSGIEEWGDRAEAEFIADPSDPVRRARWHSVLDALSGLPRPSYRRIADHIDHVVEIAGIDHVGLGSDFDGIAVTPEGMEDAGCFSRIFDELRSRGYSENDLAKIAGLNFFRLLERSAFSSD